MNILPTFRRKRSAPGTSVPGTLNTSTSSNPTSLLLVPGPPVSKRSKLAVRTTSSEVPGTKVAWVPKLYTDLTYPKIGPSTSGDIGNIGDPNNADTDRNNDEHFILGDLPNDTKAGFLHIRQLVQNANNNAIANSFYLQSPCPTSNKFFPPIILRSQLRALISNTNVLEFQLKTLIEDDGEILAFKHVGKTGEIVQYFVFREDYVKIPGNSDDPLAQRFVEQLLKFQTTGLHPKIPLEDLKIQWKFTETEIRQLVHSGYLSIFEGLKGTYTLGLPGASKFIKLWTEGDKIVRRALKTCNKYGQILEKDFEDKSAAIGRRVGKKCGHGQFLGVKYHLLDLIGNKVVQRVSTTSGPMLKFRRET